MFRPHAGRRIGVLARHEPAIVSACEGALHQATKDEDFLRLEATAFAEQPSLAFDRAVMERSEHGVVVPIDIGWSDVGSWDALHQVSAKAENGNVLSGAVVTVDSRNSYLHSETVPIDRKSTRLNSSH